MLKKGILLFLAFLFAFPLYGKSREKELNEMLYMAENVYTEILDFISVIKNRQQQDKLLYALKYTKGLFAYFLKQAKEMTADIEDPNEVYQEKYRLSKAFDILLNKKFQEVDHYLKTADTLDYYRYKWFERVLYVYLKAKVQLFNYYITSVSDNPKYRYRYVQSKKRFEEHIADLLAFLYKNKELYRENSVFIKKVFLIDEQSSGYASQDSQSLGDMDLLIEFLKGKFKDYQGLYIQFVSFQKSEVAGSRDQGIVLLMKYQPIPADEKITDIRDVEVSVQGDNLEDILTFTLNQASRILNMKTSQEKKQITLSTRDASYREFIKENIVLSKTAVLKAKLLYKKEVKQDKKEEENGEKKKKVLEVGLRLTTGKKR
jgi:hypothetical protein